MDLSNSLDKFIKTRSEEIADPFPDITHHTLFAGSTLSGKSYVMKSWIDGPYSKIFDDIFLISHTAKKENYHKLFKIPEDNIFETLDSEGLELLYEDIKARFLARKGDYMSLLIFDDMGQTLRKIPGFPIFMSTCRHYGITCWLGNQYIKQCSPEMRAQFYSFVIFPYMSDENLAIVAECSVGRKQLATGVEVVKSENEKRETKYGYFYWTKKEPEKSFYGLGSELQEFEI